jgi:hypothetical protein
MNAHNMEVQCRIQCGIFRYLKHGNDLRESARIGTDWETMEVTIPNIATVINTPPYRRDITIKSNHIGPIETAEDNRSRSNYFFQCVPDNEIPFLENCGECIERDMCNRLDSVRI